jgi:hypothetical protein
VLLTDGWVKSTAGEDSYMPRWVSALQLVLLAHTVLCSQLVPLAGGAAGGQQFADLRLQQEAQPVINWQLCDVQVWRAGHPVPALHVTVLGVVAHDVLAPRGELGYLRG